MDGTATRGDSGPSSCKRIVRLGCVKSGSGSYVGWARSPQLPPTVGTDGSTVTSLKGGSDWTGSELCNAGGGAGSDESSANNEARVLCSG